MVCGVGTSCIVNLISEITEKALVTSVSVDPKGTDCDCCCFALWSNDSRK